MSENNEIYNNKRILVIDDNEAIHGDFKTILGGGGNSADAFMAEKRLGDKRCETTYPFRDFLDAGAVLAFGSDGDMSPMRGIFMRLHVIRRTVSIPAAGPLIRKSLLKKH